jgi:hypothetical protein
MTGTVRNIKKYKNRKLYDIAESRYINVSEVLSLVMSGENVVVTDFDGSDLTKETILRGMIDSESIFMSFNVNAGELSLSAVSENKENALLNGMPSNLGPTMRFE